MAFPSNYIIDATLKKLYCIDGGLENADPRIVEDAKGWLLDNKDSFIAYYNETDSVDETIDRILNDEEDDIMRAEIAMNSDGYSFESVMQFNSRLNGLKDAYPNEVPLIEGIQNAFNKTQSVLSPEDQQAIRQFPMQFTQRIREKGGEWTTQLHKWAELLVEDLLAVDPIVLTAKNSRDESVLLTLVLAALGKYTQQVNYDFIKKLLDKSMNFMELTVPGDESSKIESSAWEEKDVNGYTPLDYLICFAEGEGMFAGEMQDDELYWILAEYAKTIEDKPAVDNTHVDESFNEEAAQKEILQTVHEINNTLATNPSMIPSASTDTSGPSTQKMESVVSILAGLGRALV